VPRHGPRPGRLPGRRGHRRAHGHAAAVPGHDGGRRRSGLRRRGHGDGAAAGGSGMTMLQPSLGHEADHDFDDDAPELSVVIPVYNEEQGLAALFERLYPALDALGVSYELIFINDGSRDRSA